MSNADTVKKLEPVLAGIREFPASADQLIPLLQYVQSRMGYLSPEAMDAIAEYLKLPRSHVFGVATFYAQFRFRPLGKNRLTVCRGTACHVRGSARLVEEVEKLLGIQAGQSTPDMEFSLETVACLGSCALAPAVVVNDRVHGKVTAKKLQQIIAGLRGEKPESPEPPQKDPPPGKPPVQDPKPKKPPVREPGRKTPQKAAGISAAGMRRKSQVRAGSFVSSKSAAGRKTAGSTSRSGGRSR